MVTKTTIGSIVLNQAARSQCDLTVRLDDAEAAAAACPEQFDRLAAEVQAAALSTVLCSYMAIEAILNELFMEHSLFVTPGALFPGITEGSRKALNDSWKSGASKWPIITKVHVATATLGVSRVNFGGGCAQQFKYLKDLRDELVHHKPVSIRTRTDDPLEVELDRQFKRAKVWAGRNVSFRWAGCLGSGCARWAVGVSTGFQREIFERLGVGYPGGTGSGS